MHGVHTGLFVHETHAWGAHWAVCTWNTCMGCTLSCLYMDHMHGVHTGLFVHVLCLKFFF